MKKYIESVGKSTRHISTWGSLLGILLSHACCLPALAGFASLSLPIMQFIGPDFSLFVKICLGIAFGMQALSFAYRIIYRKFGAFHYIYYPLAFISLFLMFYSLLRYIPQTIIIISMITLITLSILDLFITPKVQQHACCER